MPYKELGFCPGAHLAAILATVTTKTGDGFWRRNRFVGFRIDGFRHKLFSHLSAARSFFLKVVQSGNHDNNHHENFFHTECPAVAILRAQSIKVPVPLSDGRGIAPRPQSIRQSAFGTRLPCVRLKSLQSRSPLLPRGYRDVPALSAGAHSNLWWRPRTREDRFPCG
jgi:hypothetical protein